MPWPLVVQKRQPVAWDSEKEQGSLGPTEKTEVTVFAGVGVGMRDREELQKSVRFWPGQQRRHQLRGETGECQKSFEAQGQGCCLFNLHNASLPGQKYNNVQGQVPGFSSAATVLYCAVLVIFTLEPGQFRDWPSR